MRVSIASAAGSPHKPNEDWVGATTDTVVILDGLTTPDGFDTGCIHGTVWFVHQLGAWLLGLATTEPDVSLRAHLAAAIANVANTHADTCDTAHSGTPGATVAMLRALENQVEWLVLSDAFVVLDTPDGIQVHTDCSLDRSAVEEKAAMLRERLGTAEHDQARRAVVAAQRQQRNTETGYWIAAGNPHAADHALTGSLPRIEVRRAAVLSDGAAVLADSLGTPWSDVLDVVDERGPGALIELIRRTEADDPDGRRWPRFKRSDDATVASCTF